MPDKPLSMPMAAIVRHYLSGVQESNLPAGGSGAPLDYANQRYCAARQVQEKELEGVPTGITPGGECTDDA